MNMTDFKEYIDNNPEILNDQELPAGHEVRFEARLDAMLDSRRKTCHRKRLFTGIFSAITAVAAAVVAAVIFIDRPAEGEVDWFAGVADDPVAVYMAYSEKIAVMYEEIFTKDLDERWETTV